MNNELVYEQLLALDALDQALREANRAEDAKAADEAIRRLTTLVQITDFTEVAEFLKSASQKEVA